MKATNLLPKELVVCIPTFDDLKAVSELITACEMADDGVLDLPQEELRAYWLSPDINLETDAWIVVTAENQAVGYADVGQRQHVRIFSYIRVHPAYRGQGIENHLLQLVEERASQYIAEAPAHARVALYSWFSHSDTLSGKLLEQEGYKQVRSFWRMQIELDKVPQALVWPDEVTVRNLHRDQEEHAVFEMIDEAFQDHWGHLPSTYEQWAHWQLKRENFDPSLWFLAVDGSELAGGSLCSYYADLKMGWVNQLAVRRPWRRKGLGMALLLHSFAEFYRRGIYTVALGVDAQNLTGATKLYLKAGMHVALQNDSYEKELRPGEELSTQSITV